MINVAQTERLKISNLLIKDILDKKFYERIDKENLGMFPISLVFLRVERKPIGEGSPPQFKIVPLNISHENENEIKEKIMHITCQDPVLLEKMTKILEGLR